MRKAEFLLRMYKKRMIAEALLSDEHPVPRGFLQKDMGMVTLRGTAWCEATQSLPMPTRAPKGKRANSHSRVSCFISTFFSPASEFILLQTVALYLYTWHTEVVKHNIESLIVILVGKVQIKGLCYALHVNGR